MIPAGGLEIAGPRGLPRSSRVRIPRPSTSRHPPRGPVCVRSRFDRSGPPGNRLGDAGAGMALPMGRRDHGRESGAASPGSRGVVGPHRLEIFRCVQPFNQAHLSGRCQAKKPIDSEPESIVFMPTRCHHHWELRLAWLEWSRGWANRAAMPGIGELRGAPGNRTWRSVTEVSTRPTHDEVVPHATRSGRSDAECAWPSGERPGGARSERAPARPARMGCPPGAPRPA